MTLTKPVKTKNWLVWPNTTFSDIDYSTCSSTPNGYCPDSLTLDQCLNVCENADCTYGYFVEFPDKSTLCNPILSSTYGDINPIYGLMNKSEFKDLNKVKVSTFVDTNAHTFPPYHANIMFYTDIFQIISKIPNLNQYTVGIASDKLIPDDGDLVDVTKKVINLQIFPHNTSTPFIQKYVPVRYGDFINIAIPNTTLLLSNNIYTSNLEWKINSANIPYTDFAFQLVPLPLTKKQIGDIVNYTDTFNIVYAQNYVVTLKNIPSTNITSLILVYFNVSDIPISNLECTFTAKSSMFGYYCRDGTCTSVPISNINYDGTFLNQIVYRSPNCINQCKQTSNSRLDQLKNHTFFSLYSLQLFLYVFSCILIIFIYFKLYT